LILDIHGHNVIWEPDIRWSLFWQSCVRMWRYFWRFRNYVPIFRVCCAITPWNWGM